MSSSYGTVYSGYENDFGAVLSGHIKWLSLPIGIDFRHNGVYAVACETVGRVFYGLSVQAKHLCLGDIIRTLRFSYKVMRFAIDNCKRGVEWCNPQIRTFSVMGNAS